MKDGFVISDDENISDEDIRKTVEEWDYKVVMIE